MANNYEMGATIVPAECFAPGGAEAAAQIISDLEEILEQEDVPEEFDDFYSGGLDVEPQSDGSLYLSSNDEYFCCNSFIYLIEKLAQKKLIVKSFGFSYAFACSKLRPDEFGGVYYRALPNGDVLVISTVLDDLTDDQLQKVCDLRSHPGRT